MSSGIDYIPASDGKFLTWTKNLFAYVQSHAEAWDIQPKSWTKIMQQLKTYETAYEKATHPNRGKGDVREKTDSRNALKKSVRQYVKEFLAYNSLISNEDRVAMSLPIRDTKPTRTKNPLTLPSAEIRVFSPAVVKIYVRDAETKRRAKPAGVHCTELAYAILNERPKDWAELIHSEICTRPPFCLTFRGEDRGKRLYFALRWESTRGLKGPWTEIHETVIP